MIPVASRTPSAPVRDPLWARTKSAAAIRTPQNESAGTERRIAAKAATQGSARMKKDPSALGSMKVALI